jgi:enoyl-[acyl-carrier protein] reductase I
MLNLQGKHVLIFGVASEESIAWAMAKQFHKAGARISLGYQMRFKSRILQLLKKGEVPVEFCERCDVTVPEELTAFFDKLGGSIDVLVHSIAYASPESLAKPIHEVEQEEFRTALITSSYSLIPLVRAAQAR